MSKNISNINNVYASFYKRSWNEAIKMYNEQIELIDSIKGEISLGKSLVESINLIFNTKYKSKKTAIKFYKYQLNKLSQLSELCKRSKLLYYKNQ